MHCGLRIGKGVGVPPPGYTRYLRCPRSPCFLRYAQRRRSQMSLTASRLFEQPLAADLVVLSACETGLGQAVAGDDFLGLARSFYLGGARAVMNSLWPVHDKPTREFMEVFHREARDGDYGRAWLAARNRLKSMGMPSVYSAFVLEARPAYDHPTAFTGRSPACSTSWSAAASGSRDDGARIILAIEGGAYAASSVGAWWRPLEDLGLTTAFDEVIGCSAGAIAGAYFIAGQAAFGTRIFYDEEINNRKFIDKRRLLVRRPVVSVDFLLDDVCRNNKRLDWQAVLASGTRLVCMASDLDGQHKAQLDGFQEQEALFEAMRASARIPGVAGPPVVIGGRRHVDGGVYENVPFSSARAWCDRCGGSDDTA